MRTVLRFLLLQCVLFSTIGLIHTIAVTTLLSSPEKLPTMLRTNGAYDALSEMIADQMKEARERGDDVPDVVISGPVLQKIIEPVLEESIAFITWKSETPPILSWQQIVTQVVGEGVQTKEILKMKDEFLASMKTEDMTGEEKEMFQKMTDFTKESGDGSMSLGKQLAPTRSIVRVVFILPYVLAASIVVSLLLMIVISPTNASRAVWLAATGLLTGAVVAIGIAVFGVPQAILPAFSQEVARENMLSAIFLKAILIPISDILFRYHKAATGIACSFGTIALLARLMLFRPSEPPPSPRKK